MCLENDTDRNFMAKGTRLGIGFSKESTNASFVNHIRRIMRGLDNEKKVKPIWNMPTGLRPTNHTKDKQEKENEQ